MRESSKGSELRTSWKQSDHWKAGSVCLWKYTPIENISKNKFFKNFNIGNSSYCYMNYQQLRNTENYMGKTLSFLFIRAARNFDSIFMLTEKFGRFSKWWNHFDFVSDKKTSSDFDFECSKFWFRAAPLCIILHISMIIMTNYFLVGSNLFKISYSIKVKV